MSVLLQALFCNMECLADNRRASCLNCRKQYNKILLAPAGIHGHQKSPVTICNVPVSLTGEILTSFLIAYGRIEEVSQLQSAARTAYGDYVFWICLTKEGFQAIPDTILSWERQMMVVIEGRRPHCCNCKQIGHTVKVCSQKNIQTTDTTKEELLKELEDPPSYQGGWT